MTDMTDSLTPAGTDRATVLEVLTDAFTLARDAEFAAAARANPGADLFSLGLNSLQAFDVLDRLLEATGRDVDYAEFTQTPTLDFLVAGA